MGSLVFVFNHDCSIHRSFQIRVMHGNKVSLQLLLQSIEEPFPLLLIGINVIGSIPSPSGELVEILRNTHPSLLQIEELIPHNLYESRCNAPPLD
jgi:hypothetical protein